MHPYPERQVRLLFRLRADGLENNTGLAYVVAALNGQQKQSFKEFLSTNLQSVSAEKPKGDQ